MKKLLLMCAFAMVAGSANAAESVYTTVSPFATTADLLAVTITGPTVSSVASSEESSYAKQSAVAVREGVNAYNLDGRITPALESSLEAVLSSEEFAGLSEEEAVDLIDLTLTHEFGI